MPVVGTTVEAPPQGCRELHDAGWPAYIPMLKLTCRPGTPQQKTWLLRTAVTVIGLRPSAHVRLRQDEVSRAHATIICDGTEPIICDLNSRNGTLRDGKPIKWSLVADGDNLQIGSYDFVVQTQPHPGSRGKMFESGQFQVAQPRQPLQLLDHGGRTALSIVKGVAIVGTRAGSDLLVKTGATGPCVAIILPWQSQWAIYDLAPDERPQSRLNDQPVFSAVLKAGDDIAFAGQKYRVRLGQDPKPAIRSAPPVSTKTT